MAERENPTDPGRCCFGGGYGPVCVRTAVPSQDTPSGFGDAENAPKAYALLKSLAAEAVAFDENLGRNRVSLSNGIIAYDFRPAQRNVVVSRPDRLTGALEVLIRAGALDRDFRFCMPTQKFWVAPLDQAGSLAKKMLNAAYATASEAEWKSAQQRYDAQVQAEFAVLEREHILSGLVYVGSAMLPVEANRILETVVATRK